MRIYMNFRLIFVTTLDCTDLSLRNGSIRQEILKSLSNRGNQNNLAVINHYVCSS